MYLFQGSKKNINNFFFLIFATFCLVHLNKSISYLHNFISNMLAKL